MRTFWLPLLVCLGFGRVSSLVDFSSPQATMDSYLDAVCRSDFDAAAKCLTWHNRARLEEIKRRFAAASTTIRLDRKSMQCNFSGDTAWVDYQLRGVVARKGQRGQGFACSDRWRLLRKNGDWLIVPIARQPRMNNLVAWFAYDVAQKGPPATSKPNDSLALTNIRALSAAALRYASEHHGTLDFDARSFRKVLAPMVASEDVFLADTSLKAQSFSFNANLEGVRLKAIPTPGWTVLFYEGADGRLAFERDGFAAVGFADGGARRVDREGAKLLTWTIPTRA